MNLVEMKRRKKELGYTNKRIAELSGVPLGTVQKIFAGVTGTPREETLKALEQAVGGEGVVKGQGTYTIEDYYALPEDVKMELIDGVLYEMASPTYLHQRLSVLLTVALQNYIDSKNGLCEVVNAMDTQLDRDEKTMVEPDIMVVCNREDVMPGKLYGAPDMAIEILSPSTASRDRYTKLGKYKLAGVKEYWIVDPAKKMVIVYDFWHDDAVSIYGFDTEIPVGLFDGDLRIDMKNIYARVRHLYEAEQQTEKKQ